MTNNVVGIYVGEQSEGNDFWVVSLAWESGTTFQTPALDIEDVWRIAADHDFKRESIVFRGEALQEMRAPLDKP